MAVTFTLASASRNQLKYKVTSAGAENGDLVAAGSTTPDLVTDAKTGTPLRALMALSCASQAAARTRAFEGSDLNIYMTPRDADAAWVIDANVNTTTFKLNLASAAADALGSYLIVEYRHTLTR